MQALHTVQILQFKVDKIITLTAVNFAGLLTYLLSTSIVPSIANRILFHLFTLKCAQNAFTH